MKRYNGAVRVSTVGPNLDVELRELTHADLEPAALLHAGAFGPGRFSRTAYRIREGAPLVSRHCRTAWAAGELIGSITMTEIAIGSSDGHWLLGPLVVNTRLTNKGIGRRLIGAALASVASDQTQHSTVILVGDFAYYGPLGFEVVPRRQIELPGPVDPKRLLIWRGADGTRPVPTGPARAV